MELTLRNGSSRLAPSHDLPAVVQFGGAALPPRRIHGEVPLGKRALSGSQQAAFVDVPVRTWGPVRKATSVCMMVYVAFNMILLFPCITL